MTGSTKTGLYIHTHNIHMQALMFEGKCKELRDELKAARDEINRINALLADAVPRAQFNTAQLVRHDYFGPSQNWAVLPNCFSAFDT